MRRKTFLGSVQQHLIQNSRLSYNFLMDFYLTLYTILQNKENYFQNSNDSAQYGEIIALTIQELAKVVRVALTFQYP